MSTQTLFDDPSVDGPDVLIRYGHTIIHFGERGKHFDRPVFEWADVLVDGVSVGLLPDPKTVEGTDWPVKVNVDGWMQLWLLETKPLPAVNLGDATVKMVVDPDAESPRLAHVVFRARKIRVVTTDEPFTMDGKDAGAVTV